MKCGVGGSHSESLSESDEDDDEEEPLDELRQKRHPPQVDALERDRDDDPAVDDRDEPDVVSDELELELDDELDDEDEDELVPEAFEPRRLRRPTLRSARRTLCRAERPDLPERLERPLVTDSARRPCRCLRRRLRLCLLGAGV